MAMTRILPHLALWAIIGLFSLSGLLSALLYQVADLSFKVAPRQATGDILIVAIDQKSIDHIGPWPWPRRKHALLLDQLQSAGVHQVAFDIDFSDRTNATDDQALADAIGRMAGQIVLPVFRENRNAQAQIQRSPYAPFTLGARLATVNLALDKNGTARRYPTGEASITGLVPSLADVLTGSRKETAHSYFIDYGIQPSSIPRLSYIDVLNGVFPSRAIAGKTIIVGATAASLDDQMQVPLYGTLSGPLVHALAAESLLQGRNVYAVAALFLIAGAFVLFFFGARCLRQRSDLTAPANSLP